ncbi:MAG: rhodanese-like domain-containing protein [Bacteroidales bacterium]|nr:rhodanese-like domain-containing protein [Bacteroidales bacterium]
MKKLSIYLLLFFIVPTFIFTGCKDEETVEPAIQVLTKYLTANGKDLPAIIKYHAPDGSDVKFVTAPPATDADIPAFVENKYIIDIRSAADFAAGHITGAHNVAFTDILTEASNAGDKRILVVCYTGQTACYATSLLRLYGYPDAQALKWGMSGWNAQFDKWTSNCSDIAQNHNNWTNAAAPQNVKYDAPVLSESSTDGESILKNRVEAVVAAGFKTIKGSDVLESPANYFINNYFSDADYTAFGHIDGAHRINPLSIADDLIYFIDPSKKVVTYCYTGQTSAVITAYLNVLGYDAYSLLFGMNGLYNSNDAWVSNQWGHDSNPKNLSTVTK